MLWGTGTMIRQMMRWFVKWYEKCQFSKKNTSRISSLYPTERQKQVQTMLQLMYYSKNTGCITKNALGDRYDDSLNDAMIR